MKNIAVIFGGRSVEHDISILTGLHAAKNTERYRVHLVYLTRGNLMLTGDSLADLDCYINSKFRAKPCYFSGGNMYIKRRAVKIEAVLNCCHGGIGENGELAAYFDIADIPFTSCNYIKAADMQSKTRTREILTAAGFDQPKYITLTKPPAVNPDSGARSAVSEIPFPVIVKPDSLGSSIGITVAKNKSELKDALDLAFSLDNKVIVEEFLNLSQEINCSAMRSDNEIRVSRCEEISNKNEIFDFETKYLDPGSGFVKKGELLKTDQKGSEKHPKTAETDPKTEENVQKTDEKRQKNDKKDPKTDEKTRKSDEKTQKTGLKIQEITKKVYELFGASGVIRADFIISGSKIYLNEINTVPGFLAYHLWARAGVPYGVLIDNLVNQAIKDFKSSNALNTNFKSDILVKNKCLVR